MLLESEEEESEETAKPQTSEPRKSRPEFLSSLRGAHPSVTCSPSKDDNKENTLLSPTKNVFALRSPSKRPRFDLNATRPKEVKSR